MSIRSLCLGAVLAALCAGTALGQARLETRIIRQSGTLPGPITDVSDAADTHTASPGEVIRFEVQQRLLDLDPNDDVTASGLSICGYSITSDSGGYRFRRSQLTRFEAQLAAAEPPSSVDSSGLPTGLAANRSGTHWPFRTWQNANVNTYPSNGIMLNGNGHDVPDIDPFTAGNQPGNTSTEGDAIFHGTAVNFSNVNQGNINAGFDDEAWYGLYSFDLVVGSTNTIIRFSLEHDIVTHNSFSYFGDGIAIPLQSGNSIDAEYRLIVPAPTAAAVLAVALPSLILRRRRCAV